MAPSAAVRDRRVPELLPCDRVSRSAVPPQARRKVQIHDGEQQTDLGHSPDNYVLKPESGAKLKAGAVTVSGVAYNDGSVRMESVLVSLDRGQSWQRAKFEVPDSPYAWYRWTTHANLKPGVYEIWSRVIDALGRSQPLDDSIFWNPNDYEWTGVFKVEVTAI